jgi:hypothetical protein
MGSDKCVGSHLVLVWALQLGQFDPDFTDRCDLAAGIAPGLLRHNVQGIDVRNSTGNCLGVLVIAMSTGPAHAVAVPSRCSWTL